MERELTEPVDIADRDGRLVREAVGWSRHPIFRSDFSHGLPRVHTWSYWCVTSPEAALSLLVADVGVAGVALVSVLDLASGALVERVMVRPLGIGFAMPSTPRGDIVVDARRLRLSMVHRGDDLVIDVAARTLLGRRIAVDLIVLRPPAHETLNVLVPFGDTEFQYTSKQQALPARGRVTVDGRAYHFGPAQDAFACLDYGRGRWPSAIAWQWAFASGTCGGHTLGLNLGGTWTDGTGVTENGFVIDGRLHKIPEAVEFLIDGSSKTTPWRIRTRASDRVDLRFVPIRERVVRAPLGVASVHLRQRMGRFSGTLLDGGGGRHTLKDTLGLAESLRARW